MYKERYFILFTIFSFIIGLSTFNINLMVNSCSNIGDFLMYANFLSN